MEMAKKKTKIVMSMNTKSNKHLPTSKHIVGKKGKGKKSGKRCTVSPQLAARLSDNSMVFWTQADCNYILLAHFSSTTFNKLLETGFSIHFTESVELTRINSGIATLRTSTDVQSYTMLEYMLLEPPSGGTWTGTTQFAISDLQTALQTAGMKCFRLPHPMMTLSIGHWHSTVGYGVFRSGNVVTLSLPNTGTVTGTSGPAFNPPNATVMGTPNDGHSFLSTERCLTCWRRSQSLPILNALRIALRDSLEDTDRYSVGWDSTPNSFGPVIVTAGIDTIAAPVGSSIGCTDWKQCLELEERAIKFAAAENSRLKSLGSFSDILMDRGQAQDRSQQRFNSKKDQQ
ncbi:unnamed protein product [Sphagnum balticum]